MTDDSPIPNADMNNGNSPWGSGGGKGNGGKSPWGTGNKPPTKPQRPGQRPGRAQPSPEDIQRKVIEMKNRFGGGGKNGRGGRKGGGGGSPVKGIPVPGVILALFAGYLLITSVFIVDAGEEAIVMRFGEYSRTTTNGLHFKLPTPLETKQIVDVESERSIDIGTARENLMLTGDENIARVAYSVRWRVNNSADFVFNVANVPDAVRDAAESAMREVVGKTDLEALTTNERDIVAANVQVIMQEILDEYEAGVTVSQVELKEAQEPRAVEDAFLDVVAAKQEREQSILKARALENTLIPQSNAEADQLIQEARGYKVAVIAEARGDADRFRAVYEEYKRAPRVTRKRLYLETMEKIYAEQDKIVMDGGANSGVVPYLPLNELNKKSNTQN